MQALRGIGACAVVLCHAARHVDKAFSAPELARAFEVGHVRLDLFFVMSGFSILLVHGQDIGRPARLGRFLQRRFDRIVPLYWMALTITIVMGVVGGHHLPALYEITRDILLLPSYQDPLLGVAWSLQCEVVFYAVCSVLIVSRRGGLIVIAAWLALIVADTVWLGPGELPRALSSPYCGQFLIGMATAALVKRARVPLPHAVAALGAAGVALGTMLEGMGALEGGVTGIAARLLYGISAALLIAGLAGAEQVGKLWVPAWLQRLGAASYSIYLFQFVFIGTAWQIWRRTGLDGAVSYKLCFVALALSALAGGVAINHLVEQPWLQAVRRWREKLDAAANRPAHRRHHQAGPVTDIRP